MPHLVEYFHDTESLWAQRDKVHSHLRSAQEVDHFCSSLYWTLPAHIGLQETPQLFGAMNDSACVLFGIREELGQCMVHPLESSWMLATPVFGRSTQAELELLFETLAELQSRYLFSTAVLGGLMEGSTRYHAFGSALSRYFEVRIYQESALRHHVDLRAGLDAFLGRRSHSFRKSLRRATQRGKDAQLSFEHCFKTSDPNRLFERMVATEKKSWKGIAEAGIQSGAMNAFYQDMLLRMHQDDRLKLIFARIADEDVGYILGGTFDGVYRGLQFSYDQKFSELSLGNLLQIEQMRVLEGNTIHTYDLGTDNPYKARWSDRRFQTRTFVLYPS